MSIKNKLELTWIGKEKRPKLEPRILLEDPDKSYHARFKNAPRGLAADGLADEAVPSPDIFDNRLIFGDNLLALKALEAEFTGKVKCVFIDPPYNTGSAFTHYDDGLEHSIWLGLMRDRLELIRRLLSEDGSLWISIDDNEAHYLKVVCDEIFGRNNFVANVIWEKSDSPRMDAVSFSSRHDHVLIFAKNNDFFKPNKSNHGEDDLPAHYDKTDENGRRFYLKPLRAMGQADRREDRPTMYFSMQAPDGSLIFPKKQDGSDGRWRWGPDKIAKEISRIDWVNGRSGWTPYFRVYADVQPGRPPETIWFHSEVGSNRTSKAEVKQLFPDQEAFGTPKPERLIQRVLEIATNPGDLVLDSFAGSGTTGAVAHKMGRRWIMVELGEHCHTHVIPRLKKVIDGEDQGGISKVVNWAGGGGFRYYRLAPSLIVNDHWGNPIINPDYRPAMLAEALCKLEGFSYAPSDVHWWQHGHSSERDFLFVTTQNLSVEQLQALSDAVGGERSLLICCSAFHGISAIEALARFPNLTLKKIPKMILARCEWDHDDYSLNVQNLPMAEPSPPTPLPQAGEGRNSPSTKGRVAKAKPASTTPDLFGDGGDDA